MKIIFTDWDGVLIRLPPNGDYDPDSAVDSEAVKHLNILCQLSGAKVVVSSAWRHDRSVEELDALLRSWGFRFHVLDKAPSHGGDKDRGADILEWIDQSPKPVEAFVILDDEVTDLQPLAKHLVHVKADVGLQFHDVQAALQILIEVGV